MLGSGGMGVVFRAEDPQLKRSVALKAMKPAIAVNSEAKARFIREAQATAAIEHDHIVHICQVGEDQNIPFIAMQFLQGESLQQRIDREGQLDQAEVLRLGREIASGLAAAHTRGLTHRDIKPDNIWLQEEQGRVKIVDFGLVRNSADDVGLTQTGVIMGTPRYMAPEQAQGESVDHRGDLFSLGSVLYQLASGKPAFLGKNLTATLIAVAHEAPQPVEELNPTLDPALAALIMHLLEKDPDQRPQTALEVVEKIKQIETRQLPEGLPQAVPLGETVVFKPGPADAQSGTVLSKRLWQILGGLAGAILLGVLIFKFTTRDGTVVVQLDVPLEIASIEINERAVGFSPDGTDKQIRFSVPPGSHELTITTTDGVELSTELGEEPLKITAGGNPTLKAWVERSTLASANSRKTGAGTTAASVSSKWNLPPDAPSPAIAPFTAEQAKQHQEEWAEHLGVPVEEENSLGMRFRVVPPGEFLMGTSEEELAKWLAPPVPVNDWYARNIPYEGPQHPAKLAQPVWMSTTEVTRGQFRSFVEATQYKTDAERSDEGGEGYFKQEGESNVKRKVSRSHDFHWDASIGFETEQTDDHPVVNVSWNDAVTFCEWLSEKEGVTYRLPTEVEWEFACRAGNQGQYCFGDQVTKLRTYAWFQGLGPRGPNPVGRKTANGFGVFDLHGNVWEWCDDWFLAYTTEPSPGLADSDKLIDRAARGGSWNLPPRELRSAVRSYKTPDLFKYNLGFRVVREFEQKTSEAIKSRGAEWDLPSDAPSPAIAPFTAEQAKKHQEEWARFLGVSAEERISLPNDETLAMVLIPPGEFLMGSTAKEQERYLHEAFRDKWAKPRIGTEGPVHRVIVKRPFYLGRTEMTQSQWDAISGFNPSHFREPHHPVESISYDDVESMLVKFNQSSHDRIEEFRFPTEAEWEYACRAGTESRWYCGDVESDVYKHAWLLKNGAQSTHPVGQLAANPWGLYDIYGNVWEWCADWKADDYYSRSPLSDPPGPATGESRISRGSSWFDPVRNCRTAIRNDRPPSTKLHHLGVRLAASISVE